MAALTEFELIDRYFRRPSRSAVNSLLDPNSMIGARASSASLRPLNNVFMPAVAVELARRTVERQRDIGSIPEVPLRHALTLLGEVAFRRWAARPRRRTLHRP